MSNIIVRNVVGTGAFATPTSDTQLYTACASLQSILSGIPNFTFGSAVVQISNTPPSLDEMLFLIDAFEDSLSWVSSDVNSLRTTIQAAILANPQITSIGEININMYEPYGTYKAIPQIDRIDSVAGMVYFKDQIPSGAQIEVYRYSRARRGRTHRGHVCNGKRWRPDEMLARGQLSYNAGAHIRAPRNGRTHFRFAYRWPAPPGTLAPAIGTRGPLSAYTVSTSVLIERPTGGSSRLIIVASPSAYKY